MRTFEQFMEHVKHYNGLHYIYDPKVGYITWRYATGMNCEMLHIAVVEKRKGHGRTLYKRMVESTEAQEVKPYHSLFGYRLGSNEEARAFYDSLGFTQVNLGRCIYRDDDTVLMTVPYAELKKNLGVE